MDTLEKPFDMVYAVPKNFDELLWRIYPNTFQYLNNFSGLRVKIVTQNVQKYQGICFVADNCVRLYFYYNHTFAIIIIVSFVVTN